MSQIRIIFHSGEAAQKAGPATDQHPDASRYTVGPYIVDAIGEPTLAEVEAVLKLDATGQAEAARLVADMLELQQNKIDAQIKSDLNMTTADVTALVDSVFSGWTNPQRTVMKRLIRMVLAAARKILR